MNKYIVQFVCLLLHLRRYVYPNGEWANTKNQLTHKMIHMARLRKQADKFILTLTRPWLLPICQKPHPSLALSAQRYSFLPSLEERQCCERLSWKRGRGCFLCKSTCLNSSKAKGKSRLSALVTAPDKNSAETIPKTSTQAKQCTCAGMTPAVLPHSPLSLSVVCSGSATDRQGQLTTPRGR